MKLKSILAVLGLAALFMAFGAPRAAAAGDESDKAQTAESQKTAQGTVVSVNEKDQKLTLRDISGEQGEMTFKAADKAQIKDLKPGQQVSVTYEQKDGENWIRDLQHSGAGQDQPMQQPEQGSQGESGGSY